MGYPVKRRLSRVSEHYRSPAEAKRTGKRAHGGTDIAPRVSGQRLDVYAVGSGRIVIADRVAERGDTSGLDVGIQLADGSTWWYGHLSAIDLTVRVGAYVRDLDHIAIMGTTGTDRNGRPTSTGVHLHLERHWPRLNVETNPWPHIEHEPDVEGLTSSWQTGNPAVPVGDAGDKEEDDMYTDGDRWRDEKTNEAVARIENHAVQIREQLTRIEAASDVNRWALVDEGRGLRRMVADLSDAVKDAPGVGPLEKVTLADGEAERNRHEV